MECHTRHFGSDDLRGVRLLSLRTPRLGYVFHSPALDGIIMPQDKDDLYCNNCGTKFESEFRIEDTRVFICESPICRIKGCLQISRGAMELIRQGKLIEKQFEFKK